MESDTKTPYLNTGTNSKHKHTLMMALDLRNPAFAPGDSVGCRSFAESTFFWNTAALPGNASFDDEEHETWRDASRQ